MHAAFVVPSSMRGDIGGLHWPFGDVTAFRVHLSRVLRCPDVRLFAHGDMVIRVFRGRGGGVATVWLSLDLITCCSSIAYSSTLAYRFLPDNRPTMEEYKLIS